MGHWDTLKRSETLHPPQKPNKNPGSDTWFALNRAHTCRPTTAGIGQLVKLQNRNELTAPKLWHRQSRTTMAGQDHKNEIRTREECIRGVVKLGKPLQVKRCCQANTSKAVARRYTTNEAKQAQYGNDTITCRVLVRTLEQQDIGCGKCTCWNHTLFIIEKANKRIKVKQRNSQVRIPRTHVCWKGQWGTCT